MASFTRISAADKRRQDDRLTSKHVRTLQFTQSVSEENRRLQERLAELEVPFDHLRGYPAIDYFLRSTFHANPMLTRCIRSGWSEWKWIVSRE